MRGSGSVSGNATYQELRISSFHLGGIRIRSTVMRLYLRSVPLLISLLFWGYVVWAWVVWRKSNEKVAPRWRAITLFGGLCCATASTALGAFMTIHAAITGGYPFYHPVELLCIRLGSLTALLGLICAITGKGRLRLHVTIISAVNLLLWFADAIAQ
jgi:hypothetical protein